MWGPSQQQAFEGVKNRLYTTPVLAYPDFSQPFILTTDATKDAVAAVLSQVQEGIERPIAYASRQMNKAVQAHSASEAEMLSSWFGRKLLVKTDRTALTYLTSFGDQNARLM